MVKWKSKKITFLFIVTLFAATMFALHFVNVKAADEEFDINRISSLQETYTVGDTVAIPGGAFGSIAAQSAVKSPNGFIKKATRYTFDKAGIYFIIYSAERGGKVLTYQKEIKVYDKRFYVDRANADVEYVEQQVFYTDNDISDRENGVKINYEETTYLSGLKVTLTDSTVFTYNKIVDISDNIWSDEIFRATLIPSEYNYPDIGRLIVRLTDAYNSSNYIEFLVKFRKKDTVAGNIVSDATTYSLARAYNQTFKGLEMMKTLHTDRTIGGNYCMLTFTGFREDLSTQGDVAFAFDYQNKSVHNLDFWHSQADFEDRSLIADLNDPSHFSELWDGFETGECYLSMYAENFYSTSATVFIKNIFGDQGDDFANNLSVDTVAPKINVLLGEYVNDIPFAVVGSPYIIFNATSFDLHSGVYSPIANVYFNYHSNSPSKVTVSGGEFTPDRAGVYTIEYVAKDYFGNTERATVDIVCKAKNAEYGVDIPDSLPDTANTGELVIIDGAIVYGASGNYTLEVTASLEDEHYQITDGQFRPLKSGEYTLSFKATDYIQREAVTSCKITVINKDEPVFLTEPLLPKYFIQGYEQSIPELYAYDYRDGGKSVKASVTVKEGNRQSRAVEGSVVPTTGDSYTYCYDLKITYTATGRYGESKLVVTRPCYSVYTAEKNGDINKSSLFLIEDGMEVSYQKISIDSSEFATYKTSKDGKISYINRLNSYDVSSEFNIFGDGKNFEKLNIYLTDSVDESIKLKFTYQKNDINSVFCYLNDGNRYIITDYSFYSQITRFVFSYSDADKTFYTSGDKYSFTAEKSLNGSAFNGFPSGRVYLEYEFEGVTGTAKIAVRRICNQQLANMKRDNAEPVFSLTTLYGLYYSKGTVLKIARAFASDMINPEITTTLSFTDENGNFLTTTDGTLLKNVNAEVDYYVLLDGYHTYRLRYIIEDIISEKDYYFNVIDEDPPILTVPAEPNKTYKKGETYKLDASAIDNTFEKEDVSLFAAVTLPTGRIKIVLLQYNEVSEGSGEVKFVKTSQSISFHEVGVYKIAYISYDGNGNEARISYTVTVTE